MTEVYDRYMDEETIRLFCFFISTKFNPRREPCLSICARKEFCGRDLKKMVELGQEIPWLTAQDLMDIKFLRNQMFGHQRCEECDL